MPFFVLNFSYISGKRTALLRLEINKVYRGIKTKKAYRGDDKPNLCSIHPFDF